MSQNTDANLEFKRLETSSSNVILSIMGEKSEREIIETVQITNKDVSIIVKKNMRSMMSHP